MNNYAQIFILLIIAAISIAACGKKLVIVSKTPAPPVKVGVPPPPPPVPTRINAVFSATGAVNPDINGRPSPIAVRVYELKNIGVFNGSDFFSLYKNDESILSKDLEHREQFHLLPGTQKQIFRKPGENTRYFAVLAGYRNLHGSIWRDSVQIEANTTNELTITLDANKLSIETQ